MPNRYHRTCGKRGAFKSSGDLWRLGFAGALFLRGLFGQAQVPSVQMHLERDLQGPKLEELEQQYSALQQGYSRSAGQSTVSLQTLRHRIPGAARKAFESALRHSQQRQYKEASTEYQRALKLDPDFVEARINLAAQYIRLHQLDDARKELLLAAELDSRLGAVYVNLAIVFLQQGEGGLSVDAGRRAISIDPVSPQAHYVLGLGLSRSSATVSEALVHLKFAAASIPEAAELISEVCGGTC